MTEHAIRRLLREVPDHEQAERAVMSEILNRLDYDEIAEKVVDTWEDEILNVAADLIAEEILPF